jgi:hypothetical protein
LLYEKNSDSERTALPVAFTTDSIWGTDDLDGVNNETIMHVTINQLRKFDYIIQHVYNTTYCNEHITISEDI